MSAIQITYSRCKKCKKKYRDDWGTKVTHKNCVLTVCPACVMKIFGKYSPLKDDTIAVLVNDKTHVYGMTAEKAIKLVKKMHR